MSDKLALTVKFAALDKLSPALKAMIGFSDKGTAGLRKLKGEAKDLDKQLGDVRKRLQDASGNITGLVAEERRLEAAMKRTNGQIDQRKSSLARQGRAAAMSGSLRTEGQQNIVQGASLAAPIILAVRSAAKFQDGMTDIQLKANLTAADTSKMARNLAAIGRDTAQLPENIRAGVDVLAGFGLDPKKAVIAIAPIAKVGTAYNAEIASVAAASYAGIDNLKVPLRQLPRMLDVMAAAGKAGAFELKDMAEYFPALTAAAQGLGQKGVPAIADLAAAAQIARKGAGDSATAANNLLNLLNKINSVDAAKNFKAFGIDLPAALKRAYAEGKTPIEAITELTSKALGGNLTNLGKLFQDAQVQAVLRPLIQNLGEYRKIRADAMKAHGDVERDFNTRMQNGSAQWNRLMANASSLAIVAGSTLLPALNGVAEQLIAVAQSVGQWADANPELFGYIVKGIALFAGFKLGLGGIRVALSFVLGPFATLVGWAPRLVTAFKLMRTAALFLGQGFMRAGLMMLANPIVLIITAIVVAIGVAAYLIYTHWDTIKHAFTSAWAVIKTASAIGWGWIKNAYNGGVAWLEALPARFLGFGVSIMRGLIDGVKSMIPTVHDTLVFAANVVASTFQSALGIHSPSRVFMGFGDNIAHGLAVGIDGGGRRPMSAVRRLTTGITAAGATAIGGVALAAGGPSPAAGGGNTYHFHIQQMPGEDSEALAKRVADLVDRAGRTARRSSYEDDA